MGHTMRLDKIMIWISIHLHSLPPGQQLSRPAPARAISSFAIPHFAELRSLSYECSLLRYRRCSFRSQCVEMRHERTGNPGPRIVHDPARPKVGKKRERLRISRDRPANESSVYMCASALLFIFLSYLNACARCESSPNRVQIEVLAILKLEIHRITIETRIFYSYPFFMTNCYIIFMFTLLC